MAINPETARAIIDLDGQTAQAELNSLQNKAKDLRGELNRLNKENDLAGYKAKEKELKAVNDQMKQYKKNVFDVTKVLKDLNGSSLKDLQKAQKSIVTELNNMKRGTDEYAAKSKQYQKVTSEIRNVRKEMTGVNSDQEGFFSKLSSNIGPAIGVFGVLAGAIKGVGVVIKSAQVLSDEWEKTIGGINTGWQFFIKSFAVGSGSFKTFFENLKGAVQAGRQYAAVLDDLADRNRQLSVKESLAQRNILENERVLRDKTKNDQERIAAARKILEIEDQLMVKRVENAQIAYDAELNRIKALTGLTKQQVEYYIQNYDRLSGEVQPYLDLLTEKQKLDRTYLNNLSGTKRERYAEIKKEIEATKPEIQKLGDLFVQMGATTDEELDRIVRAFISIQNASNSALENTMKVATRLSALLAAEGLEAKKTTDKENKSELKIDQFLANMLEEEGRKAYQDQMAIINKMVEDDMKQMAQDVSDSTSQIIGQAEFAQLARIASNEEYKLQLYYKTAEGQISILKNQLTKQEISEREYADRIKKINDEVAQSKLNAMANAANLMSDVFRKNTIAYKVFASAEATINTYLGASRALNDYSAPYSYLVAAATIAKGLMDVAEINELSFYKGGYTGKGGKYQPAGTVHKNEYVVASDEMRDPQVQSMVSNIENKRLARINTEGITSTIRARSYASGGYTSNQLASSVGVDINDTNTKIDTTNQLLSIIANGLMNGQINAKYDDREVEMITSRQTTITNIKAKVTK